MKKYSRQALTILEAIAETASDISAVAEALATSSSWTPYGQLSRKVDKIRHRKMDARNQRAEKRSFYEIIRRLKKAGIIYENGGILSLTIRGRKELRKLRTYYHALPSPDSYSLFSVKTHEKIVVVFDIPETDHRKRDWLREALIALGFLRLQQSVFIGQRTIPQLLLEDLAKLSLRRHVHFFTVKNLGSIDEKIITE